MGLQRLAVEGHTLLYSVLSEYLIRASYTSGWGRLVSSSDPLSILEVDTISFVIYCQGPTNCTNGFQVEMYELKL